MTARIAPTVVTLAGDLDLVTAPVAAARIAEALAAGAPVLVDVGAVSFLDCAALGMLVGAVQAGEAAGIAVGLANVSVRNRRLIELTGLAELLAPGAGGT